MKKPLETIQLSHVEEKLFPKYSYTKISKRPKYSVFSIRLYIICQAKNLQYDAVNIYFQFHEN